MHATTQNRKLCAFVGVKLKELVRQTDVRYGTLNRGILVRAFRRTNVTSYRTAWRHMTNFRPTVFTRTNEQGIARLRRPDGRRFAFIVPHPIGEYVAAMQAPCNVIAVGRFLAHGGYALAVPRPSTAVSHGALNAALRRLHDTGVLEQLYDKWWTANARCGRSARTRATGARGGRGSTAAAAMRRGDDVRSTGGSGIKLRAVDRLILLETTTSRAATNWSKNSRHQQIGYWLLVLVQSLAALIFM